MSPTVRSSCRYPSPLLLAPRYAPPARYDKRSEGRLVGCGRPADRYGGTSNGACGLVVAVIYHVFVPMLANAGLESLAAVPLSPYRRRSPFAWCFRMMLSLARSSHARRTISPRPSTRETGRGTRRGRLLGGFVLYDFMLCYMPDLLVICLVFLLYISYSCYMSGVLVIYLAFLLYVGYSCYMSRILVISTCFVLYYFVEIMRLWAGVFN